MDRDEQLKMDWFKRMREKLLGVNYRFGFIIFLKKKLFVLFSDLYLQT